MTDQVIAILWDFDKTLITGYMQAPLFEHYGVDAVQFWDEVNALPEFHAGAEQSTTFSSDALYLNHILTYVRRGVFAGLDNATLFALGQRLSLARGVPEVFGYIDALATDQRHAGIAIEHYVISTGLRQIVLGSAVAPFIKRVWGCEFLDREAPPGFLKSGMPAPTRGAICDIGYVIDHTSKTRAIFEINKGVGELPGVNVNTTMSKEQRRVPFENMIYVADGPSDIPSFAVIKQRGGKTLGVHAPDSPRDRAQAQQLLAQDRVDAIGPADYGPDSSTTAWILNAIHEVAERLILRPAGSAEPLTIVPTPRHIYK